MRTPVFTIDRSFLPSGADLVETIATISPKARSSRWKTAVSCLADSYTIQWVGEAGHVFDGLGHTLGVFADLGALVDHAETATA